MRFLVILIALVHFVSCYSIPIQTNNVGIQGFVEPSELFEKAQKPGAVYASFNQNGDISVGSWGWADIEN